MNADRATAELKVLRELMERPVRLSTMSGASGVLAGLAALAGVFADMYVSGHYLPRPATCINVFVWAGVFAAALVGDIILTRIREKKRGMPYWSSIKRRVLLTILPPFVAGVGLTAAIGYRWWIGEGPNQWGLIPAIWMACYGLAAWQVGEFSIPELRILGAAFILSALVVAGKYQYDIPGLAEGNACYWTLGTTFGGYHIIYGAVVWIRHGG